MQSSAEHGPARLLRNAAVRETASAPRFATRNPGYRQAIDELQLFAKHDDVTLVLEGESGTGKTECAKLVHSCSPRAQRSFHALSLADLDDGFASSDLFGHLDGSFTGARRNRQGHFLAANGGTLFLDELGLASRAVQQRLLRAIETRLITPLGADRPVKVDVRLMVATSVPLDTLVAQQSLLSDLRWRFGMFRVRLPPLRERVEDVPDLVAHYTAERAPQCGYDAEVPRFDAPLLEAMRRARWPGNLRELDGTVHRLLIVARGTTLITLDHCTGDLEYLRDLAYRAETILTTERVADAVRTTSGNKSAAARILGCSRPTINAYLRQADQQRERFSPECADASVERRIEHEA